MSTIYFIGSSTEVKIGRTNNLDRRLPELQTGNQQALEILYTIENMGDSFEPYLHSVCKDYLVHGEWFNLSCINFLLKHPWYKENMKPIKQEVRVRVRVKTT